MKNSESMIEKKPIHKKWWFWLIIVLFLSAIGHSFQGDKQPVIDAALFDTKAKEAAESIDKYGVVGRIETDVHDNVITVNFYLSDTSFWTDAADIDKKEFIKNVGDMMEAIALDCRSEESKNATIGVSTVFYSPSEFELGERTIYGKVVLKE